MKAFFAVILLTFLVSCGEADIVSNQALKSSATQQTSQDIAWAIDNLWEGQAERPQRWERAEGEETWERPERAEGELGERPERVEWEQAWERPERVEWTDAGDRPQRGGGGWKGKHEVVEAVYEWGEISEEEVAEWKVQELSTTYISPKTEVIMNVAYTLDENEKFSKIEVTSPNYDHMSKFNNGIQSVIWMTIEEAAEVNVTWSTLGSVAFSKVLKNM